MVITGKGAALTSEKVRAVCERLRITHVKTATAMPRANGQVERHNRMITPAVASMTKREDGRDWDSTLPHVQWGISNTVHQATKTTPFGILLKFRSWSITGDCVEDNLTESFDKELEEKRAVATENIRNAQ